MPVLLMLMIVATTMNAGDALKQATPESTIVVVALSQQQLSENCNVKDSYLSALKEQFGLEERDESGVIYLIPAEQVAKQPPATIESSASQLIQSLSPDQLTDMRSHGVPLSSLSQNEQGAIRNIMQRFMAQDANGRPLWEAPNLEVVVGFVPRIAILVDDQPVEEHIPAYEFGWQDGDKSDLSSSNFGGSAGLVKLPVMLTATTEDNDSEKAGKLTAVTSYTLSEIAALCRKNNEELYIEPRWAQKPVAFSQPIEPSQAIELATKLYGLKTRKVGPSIQVVCQYPEGYARAATYRQDQQTNSFRSDLDLARQSFEESSPGFAFTGIDQTKRLTWQQMTPEQQQTMQKIAKDNSLEVKDWSKVQIEITPSITVGARIPRSGSYQYYTIDGG